MTWTDEKERRDCARAMAKISLEKPRNVDVCKVCNEGVKGIKTSENKHIVNYSCGHSRKKDK